MKNDTTTLTIRDLCAGAVLGAACGDALGTTLEFSSPSVPKFPDMVDGPLDDITGGGPFGVAAGQITDDTMMASALASSLADLGKFDATDVARRYLAWREVTFDIGGQTSGSLQNVRRGIPAANAGVEYWATGNKSAAGNGSLMRTSPIGVFFAHDHEALIEASVLDSAITHGDPRCMLACAGYNAAIAHAVMDTEHVSRESMFGYAGNGIDDAATFCHERWPQYAAEIEKAKDALHRDLDLAQRDDPLLYGEAGSEGVSILKGKGFVRVAFRLAFWELKNASSFEEGLIDCVNRGGDADTNGAIAGGLLGAYFGRQAIPEHWRALVLGALQDRAPNPLSDEFHPKQFLPMLAAIDWESREAMRDDYLDPSPSQKAPF